MATTIDQVNQRARDEMTSMSATRRAEVITVLQRIGLLNDKVAKLRAAAKKGLVYKAFYRDGYREKRIRTVRGHWVHVLVRPDDKKR